jgi:uncharacterized protein YyaL (SSP411 family)
MLKHFRNPASGEFSLTGNDAEQMPTRVSSDHDGVTPSAFSITAEVLLRLAWINDRVEFVEFSRSALAGSLVEIERNPLGHLGALTVLSMLDDEPVIATFSGKKNCPQRNSLLRRIHQQKIPNLAIRHEDSAGPATVSICVNRTCHPAITSPEQLAGFLARIGLYSERHQLIS